MNWKNTLSKGFLAFTLVMGGVGAASWSPQTVNASDEEPISAPLKLGYYKGSLLQINGAAGDADLALAEYLKFDQLIFPAGLEDSANSDNANVKLLVAALKQAKPSIQIYGTVIMGSSTSDEIVPNIDEWADVGVTGIFLDEYGFDDGATRPVQTGIIGYIHGINVDAQPMNAMLGSTSLDDAYSYYDDNGSYVKNYNLNNSDWYLAEGLGIQDGQFIQGVNHQNGDDAWYTQPAEVLYDLTQEIQILSDELEFNVAVAATNNETDISQNDDQTDKYQTAYWLTRMYNFDSFQWTDSAFSANSNTMYTYSDDATDVGLNFTNHTFQGFTLENTPFALFRKTDKGSITVQFDANGNAVGKFLPEEAIVATDVKIDTDEDDRSNLNFYVGQIIDFYGLTLYSDGDGDSGDDTGVWSFSQPSKIVVKDDNGYKMLMANETGTVDVTYTNQGLSDTVTVHINGYNYNSPIAPDTVTQPLKFGMFTSTAPYEVNGAMGDEDLATAEFANFDLITLSVDPTNEYYLDDIDDIWDLAYSRIKEGKWTFGTVDVNAVPDISEEDWGDEDTTNDNELREMIDEWTDSAWAQGIYFQNLGDLPRVKQNELIDYVHDKGAKVMVSSADPDTLLSNVDENGNTNASHMKQGDWFVLIENVVEQGQLVAPATYAERMDKVHQYMVDKNIRIAQVDTAATSPTQADEDSELFKAAYWTAAMYGFSAFQWTDSNFSSQDNVLVNFDFNTTDYGASFTESAVYHEDDNVTHNRYTSTGEIVVKLDGNAGTGFLTPATKPSPAVTSTSLFVNELAKEISNMKPETSVTVFRNALKASRGATVKIIASGSSSEQTSGFIGTGALVKVSNGTETQTYQVIIYGDVNGDGKINVSDVLALQKHTGQSKLLTGAYLIAANAKRGSSTITAQDVTAVNNHIRGTTLINQAPLNP